MLVNDRELKLLAVYCRLESEVRPSFSELLTMNRTRKQRQLQLCQQVVNLAGKDEFSKMFFVSTCD